MIYWFGDTEESVRFKIFSQEGMTLTPIEEIGSFLKSPPEDAEGLLFSETQMSKALGLAPFVPENLISLKFSDGFRFENKKWVPVCSYLTVFRTVFSSSSHFLDTSKAVLVVGELEPARAAMMTLFKMGFMEFMTLNQDKNSPTWLEGAKKGLFGIQVQNLGSRDLVNLSGNASVLINAVYEPKEVQFQQELSYLNFLYRPALILDFMSESFLFDVVEETQEKELKFLHRELIEKSCALWWKTKN